MQKTILSNDPHDLISWQDTSNKGFPNHEFNPDNCLLKYKASNINYPLFQKLKDFTYDIDIQEFTDWYSKLDRATKRKITSYNSQELIHFIRKLYSKEILGNNEVKSKNLETTKLKAKIFVIKNKTLNMKNQEKKFMIYIIWIIMKKEK